MRHELQRVFALQETPHTGDSDRHQFLLDSGVRDIDDTELQDPIDPELIACCHQIRTAILFKQFCTVNSRFPEFSPCGEI
jgi:hypothetical protein